MHSSIYAVKNVKIFPDNRTQQSHFLLFSQFQTFRDLVIQSKSSERKLKLIDVLHVQDAAELAQVILQKNIFLRQEIQIEQKIFLPQRSRERKVECFCCTARRRRARRSSGRRSSWDWRPRSTSGSWLNRSLGQMSRLLLIWFRGCLEFTLKLKRFVDNWQFDRIPLGFTTQYNWN